MSGQHVAMAVDDCCATALATCAGVQVQEGTVRRGSSVCDFALFVVGTVRRGSSATLL
jgi:translation initiation factor 6 (eIF-6)